MKRKVSEWDPNQCVLVMWEEILPGEKTVISHQKSMQLGRAIEFVITHLAPKCQEKAIISGDGEAWHIDKIRAAFEKMRGSAF